MAGATPEEVASFHRNPLRRRPQLYLFFLQSVLSLMVSIERIDFVFLASKKCRPMLPHSLKTKPQYHWHTP